MVQTAATILTGNQYLQLADSENENISPDFSIITEKDDRFSSLEKTVFKQVSPFYYRTRARLAFAIADEFRAHFVMIKGLIEFNRSKHFYFQYDAKQRIVETDLDVTQLDALQVFLNRVTTLLKQEIQFKHALKLVLDFEHRYKAEMEGVYTLLNNTTAIATDKKSTHQINSPPIDFSMTTCIHNYQMCESLR
jgi:hypothetical protein